MADPAYNQVRLSAPARDADCHDHSRRPFFKLGTIKFHYNGAVGSGFVQMKHRGVRYTIRLGIEPNVWSIAIHPDGVESAEKRIHGTRKKAEFEAHSMIDGWYRRKSKLKAAGDAELKLKGSNPS